MLLDKLYHKQARAQLREELNRQTKHMSDFSRAFKERQQALKNRG